jgi:hypothetical protein
MAKLWREERLLIDGKLVQATGGRTYENVNPATEEVIGVAADAGPEDIERAIAAARRAFDQTGWAGDHALRARCLRQLHAAIRERIEELRASYVAEVGCPVLMTYGPGVDVPVSSLLYYADFLEKYPWSEDLGTATVFGSKSHRARADRRGRRDHRLELPDRAEPEEAGLGAGGGLHGGAQGRPCHAVEHAAARPAHRREDGHPRGRGEPDHLRAERHRRAHHHRSARRHGVVHRLDGDRQAHPRGDGAVR